MEWMARNGKERRENFVQPLNYPTQAKTGLEWATDPGFDSAIVRNWAYREILRRRVHGPY